MVQAKQRGDRGEPAGGEWIRGVEKRHSLWKEKKDHVKLNIEKF